MSKSITPASDAVISTEDAREGAGDARDIGAASAPLALMPPSPALASAPTRVVFRRTRWVALLFVAVWLPAYASVYGWMNFLHLCDITVALTMIGLWWGSPLILSSQANLAMVVNLMWILDVAARLLVGRHLLGGTEYMWDARYPLFVRLLSLFHVVLPPLLIAAVRRTGYDRRGFLLAGAIIIGLFSVSRLIGAPEDNLNFVHRDPFFRRSFGSGVVHLAITVAAFIGVVVWPTHKILARKFTRALVR
jgi:hypothetical protein